MPRLTTYNGLPYEELGISDLEYGPIPVGDDDGGVGSALLMFGAILVGVTAYWWEVEGKSKRAARKRHRG